MKSVGLHNKREVYSWALYDWANSAFATTIMAGFFPIFYKTFWRDGVEATQSTFELGLYNSVSGLLVALTAPFLGAVADKVGRKKVFLGTFALFGILSSALLYVCGNEMWALAGAFYVCGTFGFLAANIFYDSLLINVSGGKRTDFISALGFSLGYLGGGVLFAINVWMTLKPATFGIANDVEAVRLSFLTVAVWWAVFAIPLFLWVRESKIANPMTIGAAVSAGRRELMATFRDIRMHKNVFLFLIAYWLYIDGVDTIIKMAVDYGVALGLKSESLIVALLLVQFVGFPAAIAFGKIGEKLGTRTGINIGIFIYMLVTLYGAFIMDSEKEFLAMACAIGLVQGGVQSLSRSFFSRLIPPGKSGEYFGFYNMLGKFATLIGPLLVGGVARITGSSRISLVSLIILFIAGAAVLTQVKDVPEEPVATL